MSSLKLAGKSALVTGASEGIGRSIALELASNGAFVIINSRSATKSQKVVDEIKQKGGEAVAIPADVSKLPEIKTLFEKISKLKSSLDIIVHNAAIAEFKPISEVTEDDWDRQFNLNAKGAFFVLQAASKIVSDGGRIIAVSTTATKLAFPAGSVYLATKGALDQIVRTLAVELAPKKVSVNAVCPGYTLTSMLPEAFVEPGANASLFKRIGVPEDVAHVTTFLASPESAWITGQGIHVNGGTILA